MWRESVTRIFGLLSGLLLFQTSEAETCIDGKTSFLLASNIRLENAVYEQSFGKSLTECTLACQLDDRCRSLTFFRNSTETHCKLREVTADTSVFPEKENLNPSYGSYYLEKICLKGACVRLFVMEWIPGMELEGQGDRVLSNITQRDCLQACVSESMFTCRSAEYDVITLECRLSRHDRFTRPSLFQRSQSSTQYFDNSCAYKPSSTGGTKGSGVSKAEVLLLGNVEHPYSLLEYYGVSASECGDLCIRNTLFPCRSFLSGRLEGRLYCGLTHQNRAGLLKNVGSLRSSPSLNYYEIARNLDTCDADDIHFEMTSGAVLNVTPYMVTSDLSPKQCTDVCRMESRCRSISIDYRKRSCQFNSEGVRTSQESGLQRNGHFNYFEKICLPASTKCKKDWAFERVRRKELVGIDHDKVSVEANTREECQTACLTHKDFICRSAEFNYQMKECRLSPFNRFSSTDKGVTLESARFVVDYFENNCIKETRGFCNTRIIKKTRMVLAHEMALADSLDECREVCFGNRNFVCRSVTYDSRTRTCGQSHHTRKSAPQDALVRSDSSDFLEISTCFHVSVECESEKMLAKVQTNALFKGKVYAKGKPLTCSEDIRNSLEFTLPMSLTGPECGTITEEEGKFSNVVVIQSNDHVVTAMDKAIGVHCSYDIGNKTEETELNITGPNMSDSSRGIPSLPKLSLHIVDMKGDERETVTLGDPLRVQVRMDDEGIYGIFVRNLVAKDGAGANNLTLIDNTGCPVEVKMMREVRRIDPQSKSLEGYLEAFTFTGSNVLELEAEVETCLEACKPVLCQIPTGRREDDMETVVSFGRKKRDLTSLATDKNGDILSSIMLSRSIAVQAVGFGVGKPFYGANFAFPVTAPSATGEERPQMATNEDVVLCFEPTWFILLAGLFLLVEIGAFVACVLVAFRWKVGGGKKPQSIYYGSSADIPAST